MRRVDNSQTLLVANKSVVYTIVVALFLAAGAGAAEAASDYSCSTPNSVRVATYKWIALGTFILYNNGSIERAMRQATALETVFDNSTVCLVRRGVTSAEVEKVDKLMDKFIDPIRGSATKPPDPAAVASAYKNLVSEIDTIKSDETPSQ